MLLFIRAKPLVRKRRCSVSIHLMLLFIVVQALLERTRWRFNTSHVTLYRCFVCGSCLRSPVSIHLMLLFIACFFLTMVILVGFQYISCYSLSSKGGLYCAKINVSIHLMLLFIDTDGSAALKPY